MIVESQVASRRSQALGALGALAALAACCRSCELGAPCESGNPRGHGGALGNIKDVIVGVFEGVTGTIQSFQTKQQNDTDRYWAGEADKKYATWLDYWTRTGELPEPRCQALGRDGAPWCARAWQRFLMMTNVEQQTTLRTFATPEVIVAGILFVLAVRASGRA